MSFSFDEYLTQCQQRVNEALALNLGSFSSPFSSSDSRVHLSRLEQALRYSLLNGGKRVRPLLVYAAATVIAEDDSAPGLDQVACSVEMIHAYSLIHDDLPAMDDDDLRRGQATCHRAFDEATAILAGDALQARAFELLTELESTTADVRLQLIRKLATASGQTGMVGGQAIDLDAVARDINLDHLETLHQLKTGALIRAAVSMGALFAGADASQLKSLDNYARAIGLAFQVHDDILDIESDTLTLGKQQGADQALNKPTYPKLLGLKGAKEKARQLHQQAQDALIPFGQQARPLRELATYIISRSH
jgi:geranylgeranyl pyrophosphate synthase